MVCSNCGTELENNALVCPSCGQAVPDEVRIQAQVGGGSLTKKEFLKLPAMKSCKSNINVCGIVLYILGGINVALAIAMGTIPIDGVLLVLLGLGIHLGKSRICAILCMAYSVFNVIYMLSTTGKAGGWWIVLIGVDAILYTFRYHSAWNKYKKNGTMPVEK